MDTYTSEHSAHQVSASRRAYLRKKVPQGFRLERRPRRAFNEEQTVNLKELLQAAYIRSIRHQESPMIVTRGWMHDDDTDLGVYWSKREVHCSPTSLDLQSLRLSSKT